jgi:acyl-CoA reductase-like NAD-dependent aldehyde dehydrogenase
VSNAFSKKRAPHNSARANDAVTRRCADAHRLTADGVGACGKSAGAIVEAALIDHVKLGARPRGEESFAPVESASRATGNEGATRAADDTEHRLSPAAFSRVVQRALAIAKQLETGIRQIKDPTVRDEGRTPFDSDKASGYSWLGGKAAIAEFTELC